MDLFATLVYGALLIIVLVLALLVQTFRLRTQRRDTARLQRFHKDEINWLQVSIHEYKDHIEALRIGIKSRDEAIDELLEQREKP